MFMSILKEQVIRIKLCLFRDGFEYEMSNDSGGYGFGLLM